MISKIKEKINIVFENRKIKYSVISFICGLVVTLIVYPFLKENITLWNGEICESVMDGISFDKRIRNLYFCFLLVFPVTYLFTYWLQIKFRKSKTNLSLKKVNIPINFFDLFHSIILSCLMLCPFFKVIIPPSLDFDNKKQFLLYGIILNNRLYFELGIYFIIGVILTIIIYIQYKKYKKSDEQEVLFIDLISMVPIAISYLYKMFYVNNARIVEKLGITNSLNLMPLLLTFNIIILICDFFDIKIKVKDFLIKYVLLLIIIKTLFPINIIFTSVLSGCICLFCIKKEVKHFENIMVALSFLAILKGVISEVVYIVYCRSGFAINDLMILIILFIAILYFCIKKYKNNKGIYYFISITLILYNAYLITKPFYSFDYVNYANVFELGNFTAGADTFLYSKMPVLDYFSAHALLDIIYRLFFSFINNDILGLFIDAYQPLDKFLAGIILYLILINFLSKENSVLLTAFFPFAYVGFKSFSFNLLVILMLIKIIKNDTIFHMILFWLFCLIGAFYQYDAGITIGIASIIAYLLFSIINKDYKRLCRFIFYGTIVGVLFIILTVLYASLNNINIFDRVFEWMSLTLNSYYSYAKTMFARPNSIPYIFSYFLVPCSVVCILIYVIVDVIKNKKIDFYHVILIAFIISELIYIPRGVCFHNWSVCKGNTGVLLNYWPFTIVFFILYLLNKFNYKYYEKQVVNVFTIVFMLCILSACACTTQMPLNDKSYVMSNAIANSNGTYAFRELNSISDKKRVVPTDETKEFFNNYKKVLDFLLQDDETFFDYANVTSLYAYIKRPRPTYIAQSPGLLTDKFSQECLINEIENNKCPLAIVGDTKSPYIQEYVSVKIALRYPLVTEYLYEKYRPLIKVDECSIWCDKNKYDFYMDKIKNTDFAKDAIDYGYDRNLSSHYVDERLLPYVIANFSKNKEKGNNINLLNDGYLYYIDNSDFDKKQAFIEIEIDNNENVDKNISAILYNHDDETINCKFDFIVKNGKNKYMLRVSEDYYWFDLNLDRLVFENIDNIEITNVSLRNLDV